MVKKIKSAQLGCDYMNKQSLLQVLLLNQSLMINEDVCHHLLLRISTCILQKCELLKEVVVTSS